MTFRTAFSTYLVNHGLWPNEAGEIIAEYLDGIGQEIKQRIDDATEGYPPQLMPICIMGLRTVAIEWIDKNKPKHFAKQLLESVP